MPKIAFYFFLFFSFFGLSQEYEYVDEKVKEYPDFDHIDHLAIRVQNDFDSNMERVRAAFIWLTHNITYGKTLDEVFKPRTTIIYYSERGKERQLRKVRSQRVNRAFKDKRGVCFDYSILLKKLCDNFGVESKIVPGIVKEDIRDVTGEKTYKNHTWNVVKLDNKWRLMDPTWATGYWSELEKVLVRDFNEHYFDTEPEKFIKDHFPSEMEWQLLETPIALSTFYAAPIFLPGYFENNIALSNKTSGLLAQSENLELVFEFEKFPFITQLNYSLDSNNSPGKIRNAVIRKDEKLYISKLKLTSTVKQGQKITLYIDKNPILEFRIDQ